MEPGFNDKMDALDLIITALKDHEKRLDDISNRLEDLFITLSSEEKSTKTEEYKKGSANFKKEPIVVCTKWSEFKATCKCVRGAKTVTFGIEENVFQVYSSINEEIIRYTEELPNNKLKVTEEDSSFVIDKESLETFDHLNFLIDRKLKCGLNLLVKSTKNELMEKQVLFELSYYLDPNEVKEFLSRELGVSKDSIVEGKITY